MKHIYRIFYILSFLCTFVIPLAMFGGIMPFFHGDTGLTAVGYAAAALLLVVVLIKITGRIKQMKHGALRGALLCLPRAGIYIAIWLGIRYMSSFIGSVSGYWIKILPFIVVGCVLGVMADIFQAEAEAGE